MAFQAVTPTLSPLQRTDDGGPRGVDRELR